MKKTACCLLAFLQQATVAVYVRVGDAASLSHGNYNNGRLVLVTWFFQHFHSVYFTLTSPHTLLCIILGIFQIVWDTHANTLPKWKTGNWGNLLHIVYISFFLFILPTLVVNMTNKHVNEIKERKKSTVRDDQGLFSNTALPYKPMEAYWGIWQHFYKLNKYCKLLCKLMI